MGKSSGSLKKKRSKDSAKSRSRKKSKSKSRRNKSKKLRREDSVSSFESDSNSSGSVSSSSFEGDYRSRNSRSRTQRDVKDSKKRPHRRSHSSESREDYSRARKRKGSKRKDEYKGRKRTQPKKKLKRDLSISSTSSESSSCSTCGGSSGDEGDFERKRGRSEKRDKNKKRLDKVKMRNKGSRESSRSCSLSPRRDESTGYLGEENFTNKDNSRRLKSIITVGNDEDTGNKDEIVYDQDDYPSCRSNDSNDGGSKRELAHHSDVAGEKKAHLEDDKGEEGVISKIGTSRIAENEMAGESRSDALQKNDASREKISQVLGGGDDLESILRQKALENLTKFRGMRKNTETHVSEKSASDNNVELLATVEKKLVQVKSRVVDVSTEGATSVLNRISMPTVRTDSPSYGKFPDGNDGNRDHGSTKNNLSSPRKLITGGGPKEKINVAGGSFTSKPNFVKSVWRRDASNTSTTPKQTSAPQESPRAKLTIGCTVDKKPVEASQAAQALTPKSETYKADVCKSRESASGQALTPKSETYKDEDVRKSCESGSEQVLSPKHESGNANSGKLQGEAKDGQFEQKTMSVMRGGEMVQVSYKVYIPKKAPALARRTFTR